MRSFLIRNRFDELNIRDGQFPSILNPQVSHTVLQRNPVPNA